MAGWVKRKVERKRATEKGDPFRSQKVANASFFADIVYPPCGPLKYPETLIKEGVRADRSSGVSV